LSKRLGIIDETVEVLIVTKCCRRQV